MVTVATSHLYSLTREATLTASQKRLSDRVVELKAKASTDAHMLQVVVFLNNK